MIGDAEMTTFRPIFTPSRTMGSEPIVAGFAISLPEASRTVTSAPIVTGWPVPQMIQVSRRL